MDGWSIGRLVDRLPQELSSMVGWDLQSNIIIRNSLLSVSLTRSLIEILSLNISSVFSLIGVFPFISLGQVEEKQRAEEICALVNQSFQLVYTAETMADFDRQIREGAGTSVDSYPSTRREFTSSGTNSLRSDFILYEPPDSVSNSDWNRYIMGKMFSSIQIVRNCFQDLTESPSHCGTAFLISLRLLGYWGFTKIW